GQGQRQGQGQGQGPGPGQGQRQRPGSGQGSALGRGLAALHRGRSVPRESCRDRAWPAPGWGLGPTGSGWALAESRPGLTPRLFSPRKEKQLQKKLDNMKPKHPEEQEIPFRLRELMRSREAMKRPRPGKKRVAEKKQQPKSKGPEASGDIPVPKFRRGKGESERSYVCRMEQEVQRILFLTKNQLQREPEKEAMRPQKSKRKKEFQNKKLEKARKKKEEKKEAMLEKNRFQDTVVFGEVVTQPPTITSRPRGQGPAEQAGWKRLLLTSRLVQSQVSPVSPAAPMSMARQRIVAEERARVIQAYRDIQRRKQQQREEARGSGRAGRGIPC
ncbi:CC137 protein, partial [Alopecoenas beccarii]|nr:CC137 protein [Alopecoenas beccarii]